MSVAKVIEIHAEGKTIENAVEAALAEVSKTVEQIRAVYVQDIQALVANNKITGYRINAKLTFVVKS